MAIFNSKLLVYQRVNHEKNQSALERLIFDDLFWWLIHNATTITISGRTRKQTLNQFRI